MDISHNFLPPAPRRSQLPKIETRQKLPVLNEVEQVAPRSPKAVQPDFPPAAPCVSHAVNLNTRPLQTQNSVIPTPPENEKAPHESHPAERTMDLPVANELEIYAPSTSRTSSTKLDRKFFPYRNLHDRTPTACTPGCRRDAGGMQAVQNAAAIVHSVLPRRRKKYCRKRKRREMSRGD